MTTQQSMKEGWYLLKTRTRQEQRAEEHLDNQGFDVFSPMICPAGCKEEILFPGYLFLYLGLKDLGYYHKIKSTRGVTDIVRFDHVSRRLYADGRITSAEGSSNHFLPKPIPNGEKVIGQIREIVTFLETQTKDDCFAEGDNVIICNPLYEHMKATFHKELSMNRGVVLIEYITQQRNIEGHVEKTRDASVKKVTVKLADLKKADEN